MSFDFSTLVTDRSQADLDTLRSLLAVPLADWTTEQLEEFNRAVSRGTYNYRDLNRVTACMEYLNQVLMSAGYQTGYQQIVVPHAVIPPSRLPDGYTELEYIESTGTQYIDTGFMPSQNTRVIIEIEVYNPDSETKGIFGTRNQNSSKSSLGYVVWLMSSGATVRSDYFGGSIIQDFNELNKRIVIDKNKNICTVGSTVITNSSGTGLAPFSLYLFCVNNIGLATESYRVKAKLYSCKIYDNDILEKLFVPCMNKSGDIGLYDIIDEKFYGNAGTGAFIPGEEIKTESTDALDPHLWYEQDTPTITQLQRYLTNVSKIRSVLHPANEATEVPEDMMNLTLTEANNIESILIVIQNWILNMEQAWFFSNDLYSGEV